MNYKVITIARQFGSGGREIGELLSKKLQIPLYDRTLVEMAAKELELSPISVEKVDETALRSFLNTYHIPHDYQMALHYDLPLADNVYLVQSELIRKLAAQGPCIIVGRCGNFVLKDSPGLIDVFLCASKADRAERIQRLYGIPKRSAATALRRTDSRRRQYYENYTRQEWGSIDSHQMLFNVSLLGAKGVVNKIAAIYESMPDPQ